MDHAVIGRNTEKQLLKLPFSQPASRCTSSGSYFTVGKAQMPSCGIWWDSRKMWGHALFLAKQIWCSRKKEGGETIAGVSNSLFLDYLEGK